MLAFLHADAESSFEALLSSHQGAQLEPHPYFCWPGIKWFLDFRKHYLIPWKSQARPDRKQAVSFHPHFREPSLTSEHFKHEKVLPLWSGSLIARSGRDPCVSTSQEKTHKTFTAASWLTFTVNEAQSVSGIGNVWPNITSWKKKHNQLQKWVIPVYYYFAKKLILLNSSNSN